MNKLEPHQLDNVLNNLPGGVCQFGLTNDFCLDPLYASEGIYKIYEVENTEIDNLFVNIHPDDKEDVIESLKQSQRDLSLWQHKHRLIKNGRVKWLFGNFLPSLQENNSVVWSGFITNITEQQQTEEELKNNNTFLQEMFTELPVAYQSLDDSGTIITVNNFWLEMLGYERKDVIGKKFTSFLTEGVETYNCNFELFKLIGHNSNEFKLRHHDGTTRIISCEGRVSRTPNGIFKQTHCVLTDITKRKQTEEQINQLAYYDTLTLLPNRRMLEDRLRLALETSDRSQSYGAVIFLDIDNFKILNDTHGHAMGDSLLIEAAKRINNCVRKIDLVSRFGGDEFVIVLSDLNKNKSLAKTQAGIIAHKILLTLSKVYLLKSKQDNNHDSIIEHHSTASIGIAMFLGLNETTENILKWADGAMYVAKNCGKSNVKFYRQSESDIVTHKYFQNLNQY